MLVFVDESGDMGLKVCDGSSQYFVVSLVLFEEHDEATACDRRIELLKNELNIADGGEFKFSKLSRQKRAAFLETVLNYSFFHFWIVINKDAQKLYGPGFQKKESFYKYACSLVFGNAKPYLKDAIVIFDGSGTRQFKRQFQVYLRQKMGSGIIRKIKIQDSRTNNLIQLADMTAGAVHRSFTNKKDKNVYRDILRMKEFSVQVWPK